MQVRHTFHVLGEHRRQRDCNCVGLKLRQRVVPNVKVPKRIENSLAAELCSITQHFGQDHRLVADHRLVTIADSVLVLVCRRRPDPRAHVTGVLVQHVVNAFLQTAPHHRINFRVEPGGQGLKRAVSSLRTINLPAIPAPQAGGSLETHEGHGIIQISRQRRQKRRVTCQVLEVLVENPRRSPAGARISRLQCQGE